MTRSPTQNSFEANNGLLIHPDVHFESDASSAETIIRWTTPPQSPEGSTEHLTAEAAEVPIRMDKPVHENTNTPILQSPELPRLSNVSTQVRMEDYDDPPSPRHDDTPYIRYAIEVLTRED